MSELPVSESFLLALFAGLAGVMGGILGCALKSRCSEIKCLCIECKRDVIPAADLANVGIEMASASASASLPSPS